MVAAGNQRIARRDAQGFAVDDQAFQNPLNVVAGLVEGDALDPVDRVPCLARPSRLGVTATVSPKAPTRELMSSAINNKMLGRGGTDAVTCPTNRLAKSRATNFTTKIPYGYSRKIGELQARGSASARQFIFRLAFSPMQYLRLTQTPASSYSQPNGSPTINGSAFWITRA